MLIWFFGHTRKGFAPTPMTSFPVRNATIQELDETVLNRLISRILVGEVKKDDGRKVQEVRIVYNFVGMI